MEKKESEAAVMELERSDLDRLITLESLTRLLKGLMVQLWLLVK